MRFPHEITNRNRTTPVMMPMAMLFFMIDTRLVCRFNRRAIYKKDTSTSQPTRRQNAFGMVFTRRWQSPTIWSHGHHHFSQSNRQPSFRSDTLAGGGIFVRLFGTDIHVPQLPAIGSRDQKPGQEKIHIALRPMKAGFAGAGIRADHWRQSAFRSIPCFLPASGRFRRHSWW